MTSLVTFLVDQQLTLDTFEPLPAQTPDPVVAVGTESHSVEPLGLEDVTVHLVHLPPPPGAPPVDTPVLTITHLTRCRGQTWEHVN